MEYFKCHWCGSTHIRYKNICPNCGGSIEFKSELNKIHIKNKETSFNDVAQSVKNIFGVLVLICVVLASASTYFLFTRNSNKSTELPVKTFFQKNKQLIKPKVNSGYKQISNSLKKSSGFMANKLNNCVLDFDRNSTPNVYLVSSYKGLQTSIVQFGSSGHEVRESEVIVNKPAEKIILVLMAYDPVIWKINKTLDSSIIGVILAGYHDQVLIGLPKNTPVLEAIYEKKTQCNYFYDSLNPGGQKHFIAKRIEDIVGSRPTEYITLPYNGKFYIGDISLTAPSMQFSDKTYKSAIKQNLREKGYIIDNLASKEEGINQLLNQGKIRLASATDIENWSKITSYHSNGGKHRMSLGRTFVILAQIQFPRGLYGKHAKTFILSEGIPMPSGKIGHSIVYLMDGGVCMGMACSF